MKRINKPARLLFLLLLLTSFSQAEEKPDESTSAPLSSTTAEQIPVEGEESPESNPSPISQSPVVEAVDLPEGERSEGVGSGGFNKAISSIVLQPDGRVVVAGQFTSFGGVPVARGLARLDPKANLDKAFTDATRLTFEKAEFYALALQPDRKILVGGTFILHGRGNNDWQALARFYPDGRLDESFANVLGNGFDNTILTVAVQPDGKVLAGGNFFSYAGHTVGGIVRLLPDGQLDQSFSQNLAGGIDLKGSIKSIVIQPDGKILVVGDFATFGGKKVDGIVRLLPNGTLDMDFYQTAGSSFFVGFPLLEAEDMESEAGLYLSKAILQPSGHIVLGGEFISYDTNQDIYSSRVLRLDNTGKLDLDFIKNTLEHKFETDVNSLLQMPDGQVVVGCGSPFSRLGADGRHDKDFYLVAGRALGGDINSLALQPDGKIIVAGRFNSYKGIKVGNIVRLNPDGTMDERFISGSYK